MMENVRQIRITFRNGRSIVYTMEVFEIAVDDPDVVEIMDVETGEIIYEK